MKKRFFAALLAVLMLIPAAPAAYADTIVNLGSTDAGILYDHAITDTVPTLTFKLDVDDEIGNKLPDGLKIATEASVPGVTAYYLRGTPTTPGVYTFKLRATFADTTYDIIEYSLTVTTPVPGISSSSNVSCSQGASASVSVTVSNVGSGTVTYQWYKSTVNANVDGTVISGANSATLNVDTSTTGTLYYYCYVSNTIGGQSAGASSAPIAVTVASASVSSISIASLPSKTTYSVGDTLNTAGLSINVSYTNGKNEIRNDITVPETKFTKTGVETVTVTYQGKSASFNVNVVDDKITDIGITKMPDRLEYSPGDRLDTTGMELKVERGSGFELITSGFKCEPTELSFEGTQTITVTYEDAKCTFKVTVKDDDSLSSIAVTKTPDKLEYKVGETIDLTGIEVTANYSNKTSKKITDYTCDIEVFTEANKRQKVTLSYNNKTCVFMVSVLPTEDSAETPAPEENSQSTSTPNAAEPTPTSQVSPAKKAKSKAPIILAIIMCSILALSVAGAYVYVTYKSTGKIFGKTAGKSSHQKSDTHRREPDERDFYDPKEFKK